jgi:hypothetical protein
MSAFFKPLAVHGLMLKPFKVKTVLEVVAALVNSAKTPAA